jgi:hypothetical protein
VPSCKSVEIQELSVTRRLAAKNYLKPLVYAMRR